MRKTNRDDANRRLAVDTKELQSMLCCGRDTAVKIGLEAKARVNIGARALWNVKLIQSYLDSISCDELNESRKKDKSSGESGTEAVSEK